MRANYGEIWRRLAARIPERTAIHVVDGPRYTYAGFDEAARRMAAFLAASGLTSGDKIAIFMYNRAEWLVTLFAALQLGVVPAPVNFRYREAEVDALLQDSDAAAIVYPASLASIVGQLDTPKRRHIVLLEVKDTDEATAAFEGVTQLGPVLSDWEPPAADDGIPAHSELFLYTGGTTGKPKAVVWGVEELLDIQTYPAYGALGIVPPETADDAVNIAADPRTPHPVTLPLAPFMHGTAFTSTINTLLLGGTVVIVASPSFNPAAAVRALTEERVTRLIVAGDPVALRLLDALGEDARLPHLRSVMSSGMRFSDETKRRLHELGEVVITDLLASTEGGPFAMAVTASAADLPARLRMTPGTILVDEKLREIPPLPGAVGMLAFGGSQPKGYYKDPAKTAEVFPVINGRRHVMPGDWARIQQDGSLELLGRGSSVVNTGGEKVYPAEVEEVLLTHPQVSDAVVFGTPEPAWGEIVTAAVAVDDPRAVTGQQLIDHVAAVLSGYKKPRLVLIRTTLDRSPSGKVDIKKLRDELAGPGSST